MNDSTPSTGYALSTARMLADAGYKLVPIPAGFKYPKGFGRWQEIATDERSQIDEWFKDTTHGVGLAMGEQPNGKFLFAIDVDGRDGMDELIELLKRYGGQDEFMNTANQNTGNDGAHFIFQADHEVRNSARRFGEKIDLRGEGGQIVIGPTIHPNGNPYVWNHTLVDREPLHAPQWVLDRVSELNRPASSLKVQGESFNVADDNPRDWAKRNVSVYDFLMSQGWHPGKRRGNREQVTGPWKSPMEGTSATMHHDSNIVNVYSTSLDPTWGEIGFDGRCYTINGFDAWMIANGITDVSEAMRIIRKQVMPTTVPTPARVEDYVSGQQPPETTDVNSNRLLDMLLSTEELATITPPDPLIDGWLFRDSLAWLFGPSGSGKSFVAVDLAMHVGTGRDWHGNATQGGKVLYMIAEGASGMATRTHAWYEMHGEAETDVHWLPTAVNMFAPLESAEMIQAVEILQPDFIIIDTLARASTGAEENSAKDAGILIQNMDMLRTHAGGACVLMIHHTGKDSSLGGRGSSAFRGAVESEMEVVGGLTNLTVKNTKQKNIAHSDSIQFVGEPQVLSQSIALRKLGGEEARRADEPLTDLDVYRCLWDIYDGHNPVSTQQWQTAAMEQLGIGRSMFMRRKKRILDDTDWVEAKHGKFVPLEAVNEGY